MLTLILKIAVAIAIAAVSAFCQAKVADVGLKNIERGGNLKTIGAIRTAISDKDTKITRGAGIARSSLDRRMEDHWNVCKVVAHEIVES